MTTIRRSWIAAAAFLAVIGAGMGISRAQDAALPLKRVGGHAFQLNFSNAFTATYGQIARGGFPTTLYLGFNLVRKFF